MTIEDLAITFVRGLGVRGVAHLVDHYGSAEAVFEASAEELCRDTGLRREIAESIVSREWMALAEREVAYCRKHAISMVAATDSEYPKLLRETPDRPHVLFVQGNIDVLSKASLSIVGTRSMTPSGQHTTTKIVEGLAKDVDNFAIVSGIAYGIDAACHRAALSSGVPSVAVLANPLPDINPAPHRQLAADIIKKGGAIITECNSQCRQNGKLFVARNRIIAGMSMGTLVVESPASGGALTTAEFADGYHRTVMALPGRITDSSSFGTNNLIRTGKARLVLTPYDIISDMGWATAATKDGVETSAAVEYSALAPEELTTMAVFDTIARPEMQELINATGFTIGELMMVLMGLELKGLIRTLPGQRYEKI